MKRCKRCGESKPLNEFYKETRVIDGRYARCKLCVREIFKDKMRADRAALQKERERCRRKDRRRDNHARYIKHREAILKSVEASRLRYPQRDKARKAANNAVRDKKIARRYNCEQCGVSPDRLEKHHPDYSKPLEVIWLCSKCHGLTKRKT